MGYALHDASPIARALFARADDALGIPLTKLCFGGPDERLRRTENAQPALFVVEAVAAALLRERGIEPVALAGHSVGEYAALHAAGALDFEDALLAVRQRGELMARAADERPGTMAAIVGLPLAPARVPVLANATGECVRSPAEIRDALLAQLTGRVRWVATVRRLVALGVERLVEVGPGHTLARLARELAPAATLATADELLAPSGAYGGG